MDIIKNNPYRIIGILSNASAREIQSRKSKISAYAKVGREINSDFDFTFLGKVERTERSITSAFSSIEQNQDKINQSLFWLLNANSVDDIAIKHLIVGDREKAIEQWEKVTNGKEVTSKNFSYFNNIGTLKLLSNSNADLKEGIEVKIKLIESESFIDFVHYVADKTFTIEKLKQTEKFIDVLLKQFQDKYSNVDALKLFSNCNGITQKYLSHKFTEDPLHNIESQIENAKKKRNQNKINAFKFGLKLSENTKSDLELLKSLLGVNDLNYKMIADNLAKEIMQCGIDYFNESKENNSEEEYLENSLKLNKIAGSIAVGKLTKDRAKDHIATLEEMKDQELSKAIIVLQSIKDLYLENERNIREQIKLMESTDIDIILRRKTINRKAVEDNIKNSIEWQKVNEMIVDLLSDNNLKKIKECNKDEQKREFLELANWLKDNSLKSSTIATILNKYKAIPPKLPFKIISSDVTNTDNKPLYTKFIRYVGLNLKMQVTEDKSVTFYIKYINPDGTIRRSSETSPIGYSRLETRKLNIYTKSINISGWGNADKCIYSIGKQRIEVYVDEYMIHSKDFVVDLAPSEKLEILLKKAEDKLKEIKNIRYLESELSSAHSEMSTVKEWQFLRSQSDRETQVNDQQQKINNIIKRAETEKSLQVIKQQSVITEIKSKIKKAEY